MPPAVTAKAAPLVEAIVVETPVEQTSVAARSHAPDEVTLRFKKWHAHANTAYQKGQFAGFQPEIAGRLVAAGIAVVAETAQQRRSAADRFMVTK